VTLEDPKDPKGAAKGKGPKVYKIRLTKVAEINPEVLSRFLKGQQSHDNAVLTAITALNVVIRMEPTLLVNNQSVLKSRLNASFQEVPIQCTVLLHGQRDQGHWFGSGALERILPV
jgi:S-adenosylmethionine:tRNA-ribosyltransferase-isomerase (queuine synthetase)